MTKYRNLKYLHMSWDENLGLMTITTINSQNGEVSGKVELHFTYMFSVARFMLSILQTYANRGRLARVKVQKTKTSNSEMVREQAR